MIQFTIFITLVLSIYTIFVLYPYYRIIKPAFTNTWRKVYLFVAILAIVLLFLGRYLDKNYQYTFSYWSILLGLLWLGFSVYLFISTLLIDLYNTLVKLSKRYLGINPLPRPSSIVALSIALFLSFTLSAYSYYETLNPKVIKISLYTDKLPQQKESIKIMHISDIHLGPVMGMDKIRFVKKVWEQEKPDIIVDTGDLVDGNLRGKTYLAHELSEMNAPLGKFAVLGNHDYFRDWQYSIVFMQKAGYKVLRNEVVDVGPIKIVGIDDDTCKVVKACIGSNDEYEILSKIERDKFILLIKHQPKVQTRSYDLFDLMLSGHTHGGVYLPIGKLILTKLFVADAGFKRLGNNSYIFVSKGIGTGGPPMRFLSPPDIGIIEIRRKK